MRMAVCLRCFHVPVIQSQDNSKQWKRQKSWEFQRNIHNCLKKYGQNLSIRYLKILSVILAENDLDLTLKRRLMSIKGPKKLQNYVLLVFFIPVQKLNKLHTSSCVNCIIIIIYFLFSVVKNSSEYISCSSQSTIIPY